jgi:hypothetical protein
MHMRRHRNVAPRQDGGMWRHDEATHYGDTRECTTMNTADETATDGRVRTPGRAPSRLAELVSNWLVHLSGSIAATGGLSR